MTKLSWQNLQQVGPPILSSRTFPIHSSTRFLAPFTFASLRSWWYSAPQAFTPSSFLPLENKQIKKKERKKERKEVKNTHTFLYTPYHYIQTHTQEGKKKRKLYEVSTWNEMDFWTDSHIWHCQQKLVGGHISLWALMPFLHRSFKNVTQKVHLSCFWRYFHITAEWTWWRGLFLPTPVP